MGACRQSWRKCVNHENSELNSWMDKVLSQDGAMAPAQGSLMLSPPYEVRHTLSCRVQTGHRIQAQTSFLWLYQSPPDVGTPHHRPMFYFMHISSIYTFKDPPSTLRGAWDAQIGYKPSQAQRINRTRVGTDTAGRRRLSSGTPVTGHRSNATQPVSTKG